MSTMAKRTAQIRIAPKETGSGKLVIQEAMQQVQDFFELLSDENNQEIRWILNEIKFKSPLVVTGEPIHVETNGLADDSIDQVVRDVAVAFREISSAEPCHIPLSERKRKICAQLLERNMNGIEETTYYFGHGIDPIAIDHNSADKGLKLLNQPSELGTLLTTFAVKGYGSITGSLIRLGMYFNKPAVSIREFNTKNDVWCQVDESIIAELEEKMRAKDVWDQRDILVQGMLYYDNKGKLSHIRGSKVSYLTRKQVSLDELYDPDFSEGLPSEEYLEQLRGD